MRWKFRLFIVLVISIPAFSGYPLKIFDNVVVPGITYSWLLYMLIVHLTILGLMKLNRYGNIVGIAALITLPVVFSGAFLSYILWIIRNGNQANAFEFGAHYLALTITMLTVIPLSLSIVSVLPFKSIEQKLLQRTDGVTSTEKSFLMAVRVFNHVVFDVLPNILEVVREERGVFYNLAESRRKEEAFFTIGWKERMRRLMEKMIQIGVEGICSAIQYVPLWAVELSQLPHRKKKNG